MRTTFAVVGSIKAAAGDFSFFSKSVIQLHFDQWHNPCQETALAVPRLCKEGGALVVVVVVMMMRMIPKGTCGIQKVIGPRIEILTMVQEILMFFFILFSRI